MLPPGRQDHGEQRQQDRGQQHARQPPPDPDRGTGRGIGRGIGARRAIGAAPRRMPVVLPMLTSVSLRQYQRNTRPNPAPASALTPSDHRGVHGGRPAGPQLRVGRPGEPDHGEPADAGQQHRRDRLGRERHGASHRSAGDQHPGGGQAAVQRGGQPCPRPGTWRSRPAARKAPARHAVPDDESSLAISAAVPGDTSGPNGSLTPSPGILTVHIRRRALGANSVG